MMHYAYIVESSYIVGVCTSREPLPNEIGLVEADNIMHALSDAPIAPEGYVYKLRANTLEWELVELPPEPEPQDQDATDLDYQNALEQMGVNFNADH